MAFLEGLTDKVKEKKAVICVVGLGYVGLPTAVFFAEKGFNVIGCDVKKETIDNINKGSSHIKELNLDERISLIVKNGKLKASQDIPESVKQSDIILLVLPTPVTEYKEPNMNYIISASKEVCKGLKKGQLIILESTVFPGATEEVVKPILETSGLKAGVDFGLAYSPERYNPGDEKHPLNKVARIVGGINNECGFVAKFLYENIIDEGVTQVKNIKTAEAAKLLENIQRDLNIALMNELSIIFERIGIDILDVINAAGTKWNFNKYYPGPGVGGHCLPNNPYYMVKKAKEIKYHPQVILAGRAINDFMPKHMVDLAVQGLNKTGKSIKKSKIVVFGLAYKANLGDPRESPTTMLLEYLKELEASPVLVDPFIKEKGIEDNPLKSLEGADCLIIMVDHDCFKEINLDTLKQKMNSYPVIVDGKRMYSPEEATSKGFIYKGIGAGGYENKE